MQEQFPNDKTLLANLVDIKKPNLVFNEIRTCISSLPVEFDFEPLEIVFNDIIKLYNGEYEGYKKCNTHYHDLDHTLDALLSMTRLIHGYSLSNQVISGRNILRGFLSVLMHDTGYIQTQDDTRGTGAKYTLKHISRSIVFLKKYFNTHSYSTEDFAFCSNCILCTNINTPIHEINFTSPEEVLLGKMLGISDLVCQMADRIYLEKLVFLYCEFLEGKVQGFSSELDLFKKTVGFINIATRRWHELDDYNEYFIDHFRERWNINRDLYMESIKKNIDYLVYILDVDEKHFDTYLRREGIVPEAQKHMLSFTE